MLTQIEKNKLISYIKKTPDKTIYLDEIRNLLNLNNRNRIDLSVILLDFSTQYTIKLLNKDDVTINTLYRFLLSIYEFMNWVSFEKLEITIGLLDDIRKIYNLYKEFLNRTGKETNDDIDKVINLIKSVVGEERTDNNSIEKYKLKIEELETLLIEKTKRLEELEILSTSKDKDLTNKIKKIENLKKDIEDFKKEIEELNLTIDKYKADLSHISNENKAKSIYIDELIDEIRNNQLVINKLNKELQELRIETNELLRRIEIIKNGDYEEEILVEEIIKYLFAGSHTKEEIIHAFKGKINYDTFNEIIKKAKDQVCIGSNNFTNTPNYKIIAPPVLENRIFNIERTNKTIDILFTSDYHLIDNDHDYEIENMYDYCEEKGINLIVNLGDFFGFRYEDISDYNKYIQGKELVYYIANYFPKRKGIYHAILGGNHDEDSLRFGYDAIDLLSKERDDIFSLGYTHALITFNGVKSPLSSLLIHHQERRIKDPVDGYYDETDYNKYIDHYVRLAGRNAYVHLLGGAHTSGVYSNYILVPSFTCNRKSNGATRLRIYFDENNNISNMIIIPLINNTFTEEVAEIVYKRGI